MVPLESSPGRHLADDMGLGKTLQALALICRARLACPEQPPFLVVAPTSVVSNWSTEAAKFAPDLRVVCLTESESKRSGSSSPALAGADVVITSYALLRIDNEKLAGLEWSGVILDEAQFVKNHRAKTYQCARRLAGAVQAGDHRYPAGKQPDGSLGIALDRRARALSRSGSGSRSTTADPSSAARMRFACVSCVGASVL